MCILVFAKIKEFVYLCVMKNQVCIRLEANVAQISSCKATIVELDDSFELLAGVLQLAGNKVRLKILYLLAQENELCVCDLSDILGMSISAVSQHLRKLKDRNLVQKERNAQTIFYSLAPKYQSIFVPFFELIAENKMLTLV